MLVIPLLLYYTKYLLVYDLFVLLLGNFYVCKIE